MRTMVPLKKKRKAIKQSKQIADKPPVIIKKKRTSNSVIPQIPAEPEQGKGPLLNY